MTCPAYPIASIALTRSADAGRSGELAGMRPEAWDSRTTFAYGCGLRRSNGITAYPAFELPERSDTGSPKRVTPFNAGSPVFDRPLARGHRAEQVIPDGQNPPVIAVVLGA